MEDTDGICEAVEAGDMYGCPNCHEVSEGTYCPACDEGRCDICNFLVRKGEAFTTDPDVPGSLFCSDPACADISVQPTVADVAARLANGGAS
jgi:hypothetical protein